MKINADFFKKKKKEEEGEEEGEGGGESKPLPALRFWDSTLLAPR